MGAIKSGNTSEVVVREINSKSELRKFIDFPVKLYKDCEYYAPPLHIEEMETLRRDKNPAYEYCESKFFMAYIGKKPVGRVCALLNHKYNECWNVKRMRFTRLDFIDDYRVSAALMKAVEDWALEKGMDEVQGPMGFSDFDKQGMLVEGFDEYNMFITIYNHPYYMDHMEKLGYVKDVDWIEFQVYPPEKKDEKIDQIAKLALEKYKLRVLRPKKTKEILPYAKGIFDLVYNAYKDLYGVIPLNEKQVNMYIKQFIDFVDPRFLSVIVDENDNPVCFGVLIPSLAKAMKKNNGHLFPFGFIPVLKTLFSKKVEVLEALLIAVKPELQGRGINAILMKDILDNALSSGVEYAETGPMLENNYKIHSTWRRFNTREHKRRRCYLKKIR